VQAALVPALHRLAVALPEVGRQLQRAGVEQVAVFERLVVEVVLGRQAQRTRLDAHVDVFGHQHHVALRLLLAQRLHHAEDLVVGLALRQAGRQADVDEVGLEEELAAGFAMAGARQRQARRTCRSQSRVPICAASASRSRLTWRALRATSVMPRLWPSSSSSVIIGR
jgi:hypothetical protein